VAFARLPDGAVTSARSPIERARAEVARQLKCIRCGAPGLRDEAAAWRCPACSSVFPVRAGVVDPNAHWSEQLGQGVKLLQAHRTDRHTNENATIRVPRKWQNSTDNFEIWNAVKTIERDHPGWGVHIEWED